jgi:hypothetical protein
VVEHESVIGDIFPAYVDKQLSDGVGIVCTES